MEEKKRIPNELMQFISGGTEEELVELEKYVRRKFPEFDNLPREDAIATALLVYLPLQSAHLTNFAPPDRENVFILDDGRAVGNPEIMAMLKERYGE